MTASELDGLSPLQRAVYALQRARAQLEATRADQHEPIAIVGAGCRLPGRSDGPEAFWAMLRAGVDAVRPVPSDRWDTARYYAPDNRRPGTMYTNEGGFLEDVRGFEPAFFGISPREAAFMDPQQRLLLEVTWEALEHAGIAPDSLSETATGVFVGITGNDYGLILPGMQAPEALEGFTLQGNQFCMASGRVSFVLGLQGPSVSIDTACSSSLVTVHLAVRSLRSQECDVALAGGVNAILAPGGHLILCRMGAMARDGRCKTFDKAADGYGRGEGAGMVVLKRLSDAERDGDLVLALILGSAVNQDGPSSGLTVPNGPAQTAVIRAALADAGVQPTEVAYVECHGTGTPLGDPIEVQAIAAALGAGREGRLLLGSAKTNIGHLESAAGIAGLLKVALSLHHGEIPPHLHLEDPNPFIPWDDLPVEVVKAVRAWPEGRRVAGLSSFGMSGTNAHVILGAAPEAVPDARAPTSAPAPLVLSARTPKALIELARRYAAVLQGPDAPALPDVCLTAATGRARLAERVSVVGRDGAEVGAILAEIAAGQRPDTASFVTGSKDRPRLAFLFTGQGAQHVGMGRALYETEPVFRETLDRCARGLEGKLPRPLLEVLFGAEDGAGSDAIHQTGFTQPAMFALEVALAAMWESWGVVPDAVIGHSFGEISAATVAGMLSLEDALALVTARGAGMQALPSLGADSPPGTGGAMAALFVPEARVPLAAARTGKVAIAATNGPTETVISGDATAVDEVLFAAEAEGIKIRRLRVSHAFHSHLMEPMLEGFAAVARSVTHHRPRCDVVSNVTGALVDPNALPSPDYWVAHVRSPVRFAEGIGALDASGATVYLEIGPKAVLVGMARRCLTQGIWAASLDPEVDDATQIARALGTLAAAGVAVDWPTRLPGARRVRLPTMPFQRTPVWTDLKAPDRRRGEPTGHPLLPERLDTAVATWQADVSTAARTELHGASLVPELVGVDLLLAAASLSGEPTALKGVALTGPVPAPVRAEASARTDPELQVTRMGRQLQAHVRTEDGWSPFAEATLGSADTGPAPEGGDSIEIPEGATLAHVLRAPSGAIRSIASLWARPLVAGPGRVLVDGDEWSVVDGNGLAARLQGVTVGDLSGSLMAQVDAQRFADLLYRQAWVDQQPDRAVSARGLWVILPDRGGRHERLATALREAGGTVQIADTADLAGLVRQVAADRPRAFVALGTLDGDGPETLLALAKALLTADLRVPIWWATAGAQRVAAADTLAPLQAATWGFGKVLSVEAPMIWGGMVDLDPADPDPSLLLADLATPGVEDQIAWRRGKRFVARLVQAPAIEKTAPGAGPVVLAGALDTLGMAVARHLAGSSPTPLILSGWTDGEAARTALATTGLSVEVIDDLDALRTRELGAIVHFGGPWEVLPIPSLEDLSAVTDEIRRVVTWADLARDKGCALTLFSSMSAVSGSGGMAQRAIVHAVQDALAERQPRALSIAWGQWAEVGMLSDDALANSARSGVPALPVATALDLFDHLRGATGSVMAADVAWGTLKPVLELARARPLLERIEVREVASDTDATQLLEELAEAPAAERLDIVVAFVQRQVAAVLGFERAADVDPDTGFFDLGMDSILSVELNRRIDASIPESLPATATFDYPTTAALARFVLESLGTIDAEDAAPAAVEDETEAQIAELDGLSEADLMAMLEAELS